MPKFSHELLERPVDLRKLVDKLPFELDQIEEAAREQPRLLLEAGRYRVMKLRRRLKKVFAYERGLASNRIQSRNKKDAESGRRRHTEGAATDMAFLTAEVAQLRRDQDEAYVQEDLAKQLFECFRQRRDMIRTIATIRASEASAGVREVRENLTRQEMDKMRRRARAAVDQLEEDEDDNS